MPKLAQNSNFGHQLRELGLTKARFARMAGVSRATVTRWGDRPPIWAVRFLDLLRQVREMHDSVFWER